jgi:hypothetical protein
MHGLDLSRKTVKGRNGFVGSLMALILVNGVHGYNPNRGHQKAQDTQDELVR